MQFWENVTWIVARAGGFTAYGLLTLAVVIGLTLSLKWQSARWPRLINNELHNFVTLLGTVFLVIHVVAVALDPFTHFSLFEVLVPFASTYRTVWMALGIVGLYLGLAIGLSTLLRKRIGYKMWRQLHVLTLGIFMLATAHGIYTGTDTRDWWALGTYGLSLTTVSILFGLRLVRTAEESRVKQAHQQVSQARQSLQGK